MIYNQTQDKVLSTEYKLCKSPLCKARGLMFSAKKTLVFSFSREKLIPLHMLFVFFPIDVIFMDKNRRVVELKKNFRPFTFYNPGKRAKFVIETKQGTINATNTKVGDKILFKKNWL